MLLFCKTMADNDLQLGGYCNSLFAYQPRVYYCFLTWKPISLNPTRIRKRSHVLAPADKTISLEINYKHKNLSDLPYPQNYLAGFRFHDGIAVALYLAAEYANKCPWSEGSMGQWPGIYQERGFSSLWTVTIGAAWPAATYLETSSTAEAVIYKRAS